MGLPKIDIIFKSLAKSAIEQGSKGTVALILRDKKATDKVVILESINDISKDLSPDNQEQIKMTFKGGYKAPKKVIFYCLGTDGLLEDALKKIEAEVWDYIAIPCIKENEVDTVAAWIKELREDNIKVQAILPNCKANHEGIINFTTTDIKVGEKTYTNTQYCSRLAGILAGTPLDVSATYFSLQEITDVPHMRKTEINKKIDNGELVIFNDGEKCKIGRAVNSLTTIREGTSEDYKKIKIISIMDMIDRDIRRTFENNYVGKYANKYDNQVDFCLSVSGYFEELEKGNILGKGLNFAKVNTNAMILYWKKKGIDLSNAKQQDIEENTCGANVFIKGKVKILDAMEDLEFNMDM